MISPAIVAIMVGTIVLGLYFVVKTLCRPKENFEAKPKIVLCKANWCGHCKKFMPVWEEVSEELKDEADFVVYDSEEDKEKLTEYGVKGFPTVFKLVDGERIDFKGARTAENLRKFVRG